MPFKNDPASTLGDSRIMAERRFAQMERRLQKDAVLKESYINFMREYEQLGHMSKVEEPELHTEPHYYIPHHPVIKPTSSTTKLRVVFDASAKTSSGLSLNEIQYVGPTIQDDVFSIILRFRLHNYVMTAGIEKMYRQVQIEPDQRCLLQILWREEPLSPLQTFKMNTVTYGTASAPYLAIRTLNQLASDEEKNFPIASATVKRDFYVDDLMTGGRSEDECMTLQRQMIALLARGGFNIRKWNSNSKLILNQISESMIETQQKEFPSDKDMKMKKTLGLWWDSEKDVFRFVHSPSSLQQRCQFTKRTVLSEIAKLYDPLGLVSPVIVRAKLIMQDLWRASCSWNESLPAYLHTQWLEFSQCLHNLNEIVIPRHTTNSFSSSSHFELHGFADSSEKAYGGAVYLRHVSPEGSARTALLCSKSRVAPLKTVSLPRLELCAALLTAELMSHVKNALPFKVYDTIYWTDSTVTLAWINAEPAKWSTFVANRVAKIQDHSTKGTWMHVSTKENPADLVSRGTKATLLAHSELWWSGPQWLALSREQWPSQPRLIEEGELLQELRASKKALHSARNKQYIENAAQCENVALTVTMEQSISVIGRLIEKHSSINKIQRIVAYCLRLKSSKKAQEKSKCPLLVHEIKESGLRIVKFVQNEAFSDEIKCLKGNRPVSSKLQGLAPFLDESGVIRVGGRLNASGLPYDNKHAVLLPKNHKLTEMIFKEEHVRNLHCGPQALLYAVRQRYWPINGRNMARKITHECVKCFRAKPKAAEQMMGDLPSARMSPARCFLHSGVDYCGPFYIKQSKRRGSAIVKCYVAVFVCLATKALHLELVSNLTTEAFLAALRRFIARRGIPQTIISDNGKNFVGAKKELRELQQFLQAEVSTITSAAASHGINWSFIPPYSPHMGGLWEAAVKSLKNHLRRIVGSAHLTFEELSTVLTQIESVLNSRPLSPMSSDPSDLAILTPAHFLTGGPLNSLPDPSLTHIPEQRLSRWQRLQRLTQHFWTRWSREYLGNLQQRSKWRRNQPHLRVGSIVQLKEDNVPPLSWPLGRITELHPGSDQRVRVVSVKTSSGVTRRSVTKRCPLPVPNE